MSIGRHSCRVAVTKAIFACEFRAQDEDELLAMVLEKVKPSDKDRDYIKVTLKGIWANLDELRDLIAKFAPERPVEEIAPNNRAILYLGAYEIVFVPDEEVPPLVAINEAIEVAREMSNETGIAFVNGVLNKIYQDRQSEE